MHSFILASSCHHRQRRPARPTFGLQETGTGVFVETIAILWQKQHSSKGISVAWWAHRRAASNQQLDDLPRLSFCRSCQRTFTVLILKQCIRAITNQQLPPNLSSRCAQPAVGVTCTAGVCTAATATNSAVSPYGDSQFNATPPSAPQSVRACRVVCVLPKICWISAMFPSFAAWNSGVHPNLGACKLCLLFFRELYSTYLERLPWGAAAGCKRWFASTLPWIEVLPHPVTQP